MNDQKNSPLVSVGLMTYKRAHYLPGVLDSWLSQTYPNFELLVLNDNSPDVTDEICREYAAKDSRIRYFRQDKNLGNPACYKFVLNQAHGEYFIWASDDDVWDPRFLEECVEVYRKDPGLGMVFAGMVDIDRSRNVIKELDPKLYLPLAQDAYTRLKKYLLFYFSEGKNQLIYGLWKRENIIKDDPLFGYRTKDDKPPFYWGFSNFFIFRNLAKGPVGFVDKILFLRRSRIKEEPFKERIFPIRLAMSFWHRLGKIFTIPYFWYIMRCIITRPELSLWEKVKLLGWNFYTMARLFFARKI